MGKAKKQNKPRKQSSPPQGLSDMSYWRHQVEQLCVDKHGDSTLDDEWEKSELATALQQISKNLAQEYPNIAKLISKCEGHAATVGISVTVDRTNTPPEVEVSVRYTEKHGVKSTVKVPDPDQTELPFASNGGLTSQEGGDIDAKEIGSSEEEEKL